MRSRTRGVVQRDLFLPDPIQFPIPELGTSGVESLATDPASASNHQWQIGDTIKLVRPQADGSEYRDGEVRDMSPCGKLLHVYARRKNNRWSNCMRLVWVKADDCDPCRRKMKGAKIA